MSNNISKCGINCAACPWGPNPRKAMTSQQFEQYRENAKRILGYMPIRTACPTCQTPDDKIPKQSKLPSRRCLIRRCVDKAGVQNCAYCARFPCDTLKATAGLWNRESIEKRLGSRLSDEEYRSFVAPFEGIKRLEGIRQTLKAEQIIEPAKASVPKTKIAGFPENLPFSKQDIESFKAVHKLLVALEHSSLGLKDTDSFAQQNKLENLRAHVLRFLWIFAAFGITQTGTDLIVDAKTYLDNRGSEKTLAIWSFIQDPVFKALSEFGVRCERVALQGVKNEDLTTGTGYVRNKGWIMKMTFNDKIGGAKTLKALQTYAQRINKKFGAKAFQRFQEADMKILLEQ